MRIEGLSEVRWGTGVRNNPDFHLDYSHQCFLHMFLFMLYNQIDCRWTLLMSQTSANSNLRSLASELISYESSPGVEQSENATILVAGKLGGRLSKLAGTAGYRVLLNRALSIAKSQDPSLGAFSINEDAGLEGMNGFSNASPSKEAGVILITQLLSLLVTFIGERLTLTLIVEAWPEFTITDSLTLEKREDEARR